MNPKKIIIVGGGAAGYFLAANLPKSNQYSVTLLEKANEPLQKVKISGGGRCNVTHAEFVPAELVKNYPRGHKELRSVFSKFQPGDTFDWFESRGLPLVIEEDQRVFPETHSSQSIIDIFLSEAEKNEVEIRLSEGVTSIEKTEKGYQVFTPINSYQADILVLAGGSSKAMWKMIENDLGHSVIPPVPSLFTFNCKHPLLQDLAGTSFPNAEVEIPALKSSERGPVLITHWGLSGPGILKLSAFDARELAQMNYEFEIRLNVVGTTYEDLFETLWQYKEENPSLKIDRQRIWYDLSKRFWHRILFLSSISLETYWAELSKKQVQEISRWLTGANLPIKGKSTFKEEFVTAGGIDLKEIDMRTMQSKFQPNVYFAGETLNIDAITGGFNFQACWSEAFIIAEHVKKIVR